MMLLGGAVVEARVKLRSVNTLNPRKKIAGSGLAIAAPSMCIPALSAGGRLRTVLAPATHMVSCILVCGSWCRLVVRQARCK